MELESIQMDPEQARAAYEDYAAAVKLNRDSEDHAIARRGYKGTLADGRGAAAADRRPLAAGGTTTVRGPDMAPRRRRSTRRSTRLAACRADAKVAFTSGVDRDGGGCWITADRRNNELHSLVTARTGS